jgi:hypothetical protein
MKSTVLVEDFDIVLELIPSKRHSNAFVIHPKNKPHRAEVKITAEDWNKFEKDIADAFEKIP